MGRDALIATNALVATVLAAVWGAEPAQRGAALLVRLHAHSPCCVPVGGKTRAWLSLLSTHATHGGFSTH
eukprot:scaffold38248_cov105-Phaeocystis_antarctica.AAC.1